MGKALLDQLSLKQIQHFIEVAEQGSFVKAADRLGMSAPAVTNAIKKLEQHLGTRLFERTTRSVRLTEAGDDFFKHCLLATAQLRAGLECLQQSQHELGGNIHISAPADLARTLVSTWLQEFICLHPKIRVELTVTDAVTNLYQSPVDLAIRYTTPQDSTLIARELFPAKRIACASPKYLGQFGDPQTPSELQEHRCLTYKVNNQVDRQWRFSGPTHKTIGQEQVVEISPFATFDDSSLARQWAIDAMGIVYKSELDVMQDISDGTLTPVLANYVGQSSSLYLIYPSRLATKRLQKLTDFLLQKFAKLQEEKF